jgi:DNA gyrase subunit A
MRIMPGPGLPDRRPDPRPRRHPLGLRTGRGSIPLRARCEIEEMRGGRQCIAVSEVPYQVNKATLLERIAELVRAKQVEGVSDLRDESDRDGLRHRHRAEARRDGGGGAEPALPHDAAPDLVSRSTSSR